jgi:hypothetical protein
MPRPPNFEGLIRNVVCDQPTNDAGSAGRDRGPDAEGVVEAESGRQEPAEGKHRSAGEGDFTMGLNARRLPRALVVCETCVTRALATLPAGLWL